MSNQLNELVNELRKAKAELDEVRQNLADMDIGDDLLSLTDKGIDRVKDVMERLQMMPARNPQ